MVADDRDDFGIDALGGVGNEIMCKWLSLLPRHNQIVLHGKHSWNAIGLQSRHVLV
jgi:hypothetical protein